MVVLCKKNENDLSVNFLKDKHYIKLGQQVVPLAAVALYPLQRLPSALLQKSAQTPESGNKPP